MIPEFPQFKKLELSDKNNIERITAKYPPYSDFNFTSLWSWDLKNEILFSRLNNNLVVRFMDYITGEPFYSFIGENNTSETALQLLKLSNTENITLKLDMIPEVSINELDATKFSIVESRNHFDYILSLDLISKFEHKTLREHANFKRRFLDEYENEWTVKIIDLCNTKDRSDIMSLTTTWTKNKLEQEKGDLEHLEDVVKKFFIIQDKYRENFVSVGIYHKDTLIAYTINELLGGDYCVCHFMKCDNSFKGIYSHLVSETSIILSKAGKKYINFEQDLGLMNLRQAKKTFQPINFLKKYTITSL